jgi:hypothetical protein
MRAREGRVFDARNGTTLCVIRGDEPRSHDGLVEDQNKGRAEELLVAGNLSDRISISWPLRRRLSAWLAQTIECALWELITSTSLCTVGWSDDLAGP